MSNKFAAQCNVLLVDDSAELLPMLEQMLTAEGYRVQTAASREQALERLQDERFHVAVIDARLDDRDPYNYDGFRLVRDVRAVDPSTAVILLTIAADLDIAREALYSVSGEFHPVYETSRTIASAFLEKTPRALQWLPACIERVFEDVVQVNWSLQIVDLEQFMVLMPRRMRFAGISSIPEIQSELDELLRKLFAEWERIEIHTIAEQNQGYNRAFVFQVTPYDADGEGPLLIARVGEISTIEREVQRFRDYVENRAHTSRHPSAILAARRTRNLGGMIYRFEGLGGNIRDFAQFFHRTKDRALITNVIGNLFVDTLALEHSQKRVMRRGANLRDVYSRLLRLDDDELQSKVDELLVIARSLGRSSLAEKFGLQNTARLINPLEYFKRGNFKASYVETTIHGDLHGHNVLIDYCNDTWLMDFANTGRGPLLQDYIAFEASLLVENNECPPGVQLFDWSRALFSQPGELFPMMPDRLTSAPELIKTHQAIMTVRRLAQHGSSGEAVNRAYLMGLFFTMLRLVTVRFLTPPKRFHALTVSALVAENLMALDNGSPVLLKF